LGDTRPLDLFSESPPLAAFSSCRRSAHGQASPGLPGLCGGGIMATEDCDGGGGGGGGGSWHSSLLVGEMLRRNRLGLRTWTNVNQPLGRRTV